MQIVKTTDYSSFKLIMSNREIDEKHVRKLVKSIQRKNLLFVRPLIVNDKMQLIDGQHRLAAAKEVKADVYYLKVTGLTKADIAVLNTAQKNWTAMDFINFYAVEGNEHYKNLAALIDKYYWIKPSALVRISCGDSASKIKDGGGKIKDLKQVTAFCEWLRSIEPRFDFISETACTMALFSACKEPGKAKHFALLATPKNFYKCGGGFEYTKLVQQIFQNNTIKS